MSFVGHNDPRNASQALQQLAEKPLGRGRAAPALDQDVENISLLVDRPPKIVLLAADADEHFVHVPLVARLRPAPIQPVGEDPTKAQAPLADALVADDDPTRRQDQLDVAKAQTEAMIKPHGMLDDLAGKRKPRYGF